MTEIILLGETHGTNEIPLKVLELLKKIAHKNFALEIPSNLQEDVDNRIFKNSFFKGKDGRGLSYKVLLEKHEGKVHCFDGTKFFSRTKDMTNNISKLRKPVIVLTGNYHASKKAFFNNLYKELSKKYEVKTILLKPLSGTFYNFKTRNVNYLNLDHFYDEVIEIKEVSSVKK